MVVLISKILHCGNNVVKRLLQPILGAFSVGAYMNDEGEIQSGITFDASGKMEIDPNNSTMQVDDKGNITYTGTKEALTSGSNFVKESIGGQYGMADRIGNKATAANIAQSPCL